MKATKLSIPPVTVLEFASGITDEWLDGAIFRRANRHFVVTPERKKIESVPKKFSYVGKSMLYTALYSKFFGCSIKRYGDESLAEF